MEMNSVSPLKEQKCLGGIRTASTHGVCAMLRCEDNSNDNVQDLVWDVSLYIRHTHTTPHAVHCNKFVSLMTTLH